MEGEIKVAGFFETAYLSLSLIPPMDAAISTLWLKGVARPVFDLPGLAQFYDGIPYLNDFINLLSRLHAA